MVKVHYDEGVANHVDPEPCGRDREVAPEASAGARIGQPSSRERSTSIPDADAVVRAEGNTGRRVIASAFPIRRGRRTWHVRKLFVSGNRETSCSAGRLRRRAGPCREGEEL